MAKPRKYSAEHQKRWQQAIHSSWHEGITVVDADGYIVSINSAAQRLLMVKEEDVVGKHQSEIAALSPVVKRLEQLQDNFHIVREQNMTFVAHKQEIYSGDEFLGTMYAVYKLQEIQQMEMDVRRKISVRGFVASNSFSHIAGDGPAFAEAKEKARKYAESRANILLLGESGCGKEIFAQSIHNHSPCAAGPFLAINCAALGDNLLEAELFGYEDGAFTGARKGGKEGLFELAHKGSLFLDEIGEMPLSIQAKLLRVLQEREVRRLGGDRNIPVETRFIFATNRDLGGEVEAGRFRSDLFYRINVLTLRIPPLREHKEDIPAIASELAARLSRQSGKLLVLNDDCLAALAEYDWPGNVRELSNTIERIHILDQLTPQGIRAMLDEIRSYRRSHAAAKQQADTPAETETRPGSLRVPVDTMENIEYYIIAALLRQYRGDKKQVCHILGMSQTTLWRKIKEPAFSAVSEQMETNISK